MGIPRVGDLEIQQDLAHERREWLVRKIGWTFLSLVWLAGLMGFFGSGPLSEAVATGSGLRLEYDRFVRYTAPVDLRLHLGPPATAHPKVRVWVDRQYLQDLQIESVLPEPESVETGPDRIVFIIPLAEVGPPTAVTLRLQTQRIGILEGQVGVAEGGALRFQQIVYP